MFKTVCSADINYEVLNFIYTATGCAVNAYAMITGYFGVNEGKTKYKNLVLLWLRAIWYGTFIALGFAIFFPGSTGIRMLLKTFFPITGRAYWYLTAYFMLCLFKPILNSAIKSLSRSQFGGLIVFFLAIICIPAMLNIDAFRITKGFSAWWLMILYMIGAYIRKYGLLKRVKTIWLWLIYFGAISFDFFKCFVYDILHLKLKGEMPFYEDAMNYMAATMVIAAVCLVLIFERIQISNSRLQNILPRLSSMSFSVYLIHVNILVWDYLLDGKYIFIAQENAALSAAMALVVSGCVFICCIILDIPREILFSKLNLKQHIFSIENNIAERLEKFSKSVQTTRKE